MRSGLGSVRRRVRWAALAVAVVAAPMVAAGVAGASESADGCVRLDATGAQVWAGRPNADVDAMGTVLSNLADKYPADIAGAAACSDYGGAVLFAKTVTDPIARQVNSLAQSHPGYGAYIKMVPHSANDFEAAGNVLRSDDWLTSTLSGFGPDLVSGGFRIDLPPQESRAEFDAAAAAVRRRVVELIGSEYPVTVEEQAFATPAASRQSGSAPFILSWAGDSIILMAIAPRGFR